MGLNTLDLVVIGCYLAGVTLFGLRFRSGQQAGYDLASDAVGFRVLDLEFHHLLMRIAGNPFLERVAQSLYELGIEYRRVASEMPGLIARSAAEHDAIVEALASRDAERAVAATRAHLNSISRSTFEAMQILGVARRRAPAG